MPRLPNPLTLLTLLALAGCASAPPTTSGTPSTTTLPPAPQVSQAPPAASASGLFGSGLSDALEPQRVRLQGALKGTPVVVEATPERALRVAVPLKNSFEPGRSAVRPALAAVLDQLATGFKPYAATAELRIATPDDPQAKVAGRLSKQRHASVRDYLVGRGVPVSRIAAMGAVTTGETVEVLVADRPLSVK